MCYNFFTTDLISFKAHILTNKIICKNAFHLGNCIFKVKQTKIVSKCML